jgi:hypothetical protein
MNTTIQVTLDAKLTEELQKTIAQQGESIEHVFADAARKYLRDVREKKLQAEFERYQTMHAKLKEKYLGQHVAIYQGRLIDHDTDPIALVRRVDQRFGQAPVLITQVGEKPIREFLVRRPRLVRST